MAPIKTKKKALKKGTLRGKKKASEGGCCCADASSSSSSSSDSSSSFTETSSSDSSSSDYTTSSSESESDCSDCSDTCECPCAPTRKRGGKKVQAARQAKLASKKKRTGRRAKPSTSYCSSDYDSSDNSFKCSKRAGRKCKG